MKRRHLAEMRVALGASYKTDPRYQAKSRQPAAILTLDDLASFASGLEALNRTDRLLALNATNREELSIDGDLYQRHQRNCI